MTALVAFLEGRGPDGAGRTLDQVLAFDDRQLERHHDFIQWLFPLREPSRAEPGSPVLSDEEARTLPVSPAAQANLTRAAERMRAFYATTDAWRARADHNHLRITRIIASLRDLVGDPVADAFRAEILKLAEGAPVSATSRAYWDAA